ncbi:hypothetical protein GCM10009789_36310 [Kribbella sancticallisti]|uniref:Uncharacterized protein n=1 Tax=Kribbella sancticallisti TaxID=460087 RepID=A0ABN2DKF7_9ACTN
MQRIAVEEVGQHLEVDRYRGQWPRHLLVGDRLSECGQEFHSQYVVARIISLAERGDAAPYKVLVARKVSSEQSLADVLQDRREGTSGQYADIAGAQPLQRLAIPPDVANACHSSAV